MGINEFIHQLGQGKSRHPHNGDIVTGAATVILAMGAGRDAANSMHDYLTIGW